MAADKTQETVHGLLAASTAELEQILAEADAEDIAMREPPPRPAPCRLPAQGTCEVMVLGHSAAATGCSPEALAAT